ncbi:hypothetical protein [Longitalea luteola]|uniref:hypothetical protein n=1 Tax=Longitalea luteola TaxID=2812563 RepID=UPI001A963CCB|nr:hypothetical protein [Longitalea luteola]
MTNEIVESIKPHFEAASFFSVPDGEISGYFLIDEQGQSVDCNVYNPKYGKQYGATFFNGVEYEDPITGKKIRSQYLLEVLCELENGDCYNKDGIKVFKKKVSIPKIKTASAEKDFHHIYEREKNKLNIKDEAFFMKFLLEFIVDKEKEYKAIANYNERNAQTLEVFYSFKKWLILKKNAKEANLRLKEVLKCKDLKELIERYGNDKELLDNYYKGLEFAPNKERFIQNQIDIQENTLKRYGSRFRYSNDAEIEIGHYKRIGFEWVNNGYNATVEDFERLSYRNTLQLSSPLVYRDQVSFMLLNEIARGASLAFHVAFLNDQLKLFKVGQLPKTTDAFSITFSADNSIKFRDDKVFFPFSCQAVADLLCRLREKLVDRNVCSTDLQSFPQLIFEETDLKYHPELAAWVFNIIESWVMDVEVDFHLNKRKRLFDTFLEECKSKALSAKSSSAKSKIQAPVIALFCLIINEAGIICKEPTENITSFCTKVCNRYNFSYSDRVRQTYSSGKTKGNIQKLKDQILPRIDEETRQKINYYLK